MRRLILGLAIAGCASQGPPPGGPPDPDPPQIDTTVPASGTIGVRPARIVFRFNEVVSEQPRGTSTRGLADLFLISPRRGDPDVDWHRDEIHVRPRRGWRPNTVYTITMLPGLSDLRNNVRREGATIVFTTGGPIPETRLDGIVYDWIAGRPIASAMVLAVPVDDSVEYLTQTDSVGRFTFRHLPEDVYSVTGFADANRNRTLDPREMYGLEKITVQDTARVELLAFVHDTIGPGVGEVSVRDSLTLRVQMDRPIAVDQVVDPANFALQRADSTTVAIASVDLARQFEQRQAELARQRRDSLRAAGDTAAAIDTVVRRPPARPGRAADTATAAPPSRPAPQSEVVIILAEPLQPSSTYRLRAIDIRGLLGHSRSADRVFQTPAPRPERQAEPPVPRPPGTP